MGLLLRLIPEPYATLLLAGAVFLAWLYGDLTGSARQAQREQITTLNQTVSAMQRQRDAAVEIQTQMATRLSEVRAESVQREKETDDLVEQLRAKPAAQSCLLDDDRRMRLRSIRIGSPGPHPAAR